MKRLLILMLIVSILIFRLSNGLFTMVRIFHSQCSGNDLADKTLTQLFGMPGVCKLGLIEAGCTESEASLVRAYWVNEFNIPQVTVYIYSILFSVLISCITIIKVCLTII